MRCSRRASSTSASSPCARRRNTCARAASRCGCEGLARRSPVEWRGPDSGCCPGNLFRKSAHRRLDEPRRLAADRGAKRSGVLVALAQEALAQGRGIRPRAKAGRAAPGLRRRRGAAQGRAGGRHRLPYRPRKLLFPQTREREMGDRGSGAQGSCPHLQKMKHGLAETLERIAETIKTRKAGDPAKSYVAKL